MMGSRLSGFVVAFATIGGCEPSASIRSEPERGPGGGNFPPFAAISATPDDGLTGVPIAFSGAASVDPDAGPSALTYAWDFGDGATASGVDVGHTFGAPGVYDVLLTVSDGQDIGIKAITVHVVDAPAPSATRSSSALAIDDAGGALWVANADSGSVTRVDIAALQVSDEQAICQRPRTLALSPAGDRLYVACQGDAALVVADAVTLEIIASVPVGLEPHGVVVDPAGGRVFVSAQGADSIAVVDPLDLTVTLVAVSDGPRALCLDGARGRLFVTHFLTRGAEAAVTVLDTSTLEVSVAALAVDTSVDTGTSGAGYPNVLGAAAVEPLGRRVFIGGLKSNTERGLFLSGEPLLPQNRVRGVMAPLDASTLADLAAERIDTNDADSVAAIAFSPLGHYAFFAHQGAGRVSVYSLPQAAMHDASDEAPLPFVARFDAGEAPNALAVTPDGRTLFVGAELSRSVLAFDVESPRAPVYLAEVSVTAEPLDPEIAWGKRLFHRSRAPEHAKENYIACASCHPDSGSDGRTWDFTDAGEGLRNTIDLRGRAGTAHGPLHWSANFDEVQDFENDIVHGFGGTGLAVDGAPPNPPLGAPNAGRSEALDALAAYVGSLSGPRPGPHALDPATVARGRAIFESAETGCSACHPAPLYTDSRLTSEPTYALHDVGTLGPGSGSRLGGPLPGLDTPSLVGLWDGAPYLHDGSAADLRAVLTTRNEGDRHGRTSHLGATELEELETFLLSIAEASPPEGQGGAGGAGGAPPVDAPPAPDDAPPDGCACRSSSDAPAPSSASVFVLSLLLLLRRGHHARSSDSTTRPTKPPSRAIGVRRRRVHR